MSNYSNASPAAILEGIQDVSGRRVDPEPELLPMHLPHVFLYAPAGDETALHLNSADAKRIFGDDALNYRSPYANHSTAFINEVILKAGQSAVYQRIIPKNAKRPNMRVGVEILETAVKVYERNTDGSYKLNSELKPIDTGETRPGVVARWVVAPIGAGTEDVPDGIGLGVKHDGTLAGPASEKSTFYPFFDLDHSHFGQGGNNTGFRLMAPTLRSSSPADESLMTRLSAYVYRLQMLQRPNARTTPVVTQDLNSAPFVEFTLRPNSYDDRTNREYHADDVIVPSYRSVDPTTGYAPIYGPLREFHVYQDNIDTVLGLIHAKEKAFQPSWPDLPESKYLVNVLTGRDVYNNPLYALAVQGTLEGGVVFNETSVQYLQGGADGDMSDAEFNKSVKEQFDNFGSLTNQYLDIARFPQSVYYDTGFDVETKKSMLKVLGARKDVWVCLSTQDVSLKQNDQATESSMAIALRTAAEQFPEAELYGTSVVRCVIVGQSGYLINSSWKRLVPGTFEIAYALAQYCGSGDGVMKGRFAADVTPNNKVKLLKGMQTTWKSDQNRIKDWDNGLVWAQSYDTRSDFYAGMQTVYRDDTSILNALINMIICVEVQKINFRVWREFTGRSDLTPAQRADRINRRVRELVKDRFDERVVIVPDTYETKYDEQRGYSETCKIHVYGNNMKTVTSFTVVAHRRSELDQ